MTDVIGYAGQIIQVIQAIRGVYIRVKGIGPEIESAMNDCKNMEVDVKTLEKLFNKQNRSKFPEQYVPFPKISSHYIRERHGERFSADNRYV